MCQILEVIRHEKEIAWIKREHHEVMRRTREEWEHLDKCLVCSGVIELYKQLWNNARIGVDVYQPQGVK